MDTTEMNLETAGIEIPEVEAPEVEAPEVEAPEVEAPDFENNSARFNSEDDFNGELGFGTDLGGLSIDPSAVLEQYFSFDQADISMLLDKSLGGDVRQINVGGDSFTPFVRSVPVNNYPGPGDLSQGTIENAVAQSGESNIPTPVDGYIQVLAPDGKAYPNSRQLSNTLGDQGDSFTPEEAGYNNLFMGTGQYIDHGLGLTPKTNDPANGGGEMDIYLPDNDILNGRGFDFTGNPVSKLSLLPRAEPDPGTAEPLQAEYTNSTTPFADQDQSYGRSPLIHDLIREKDSLGNYTSNLVDNESSSNSALHVFQEDAKSDSLASIYDVLVNSAPQFGYENQDALVSKIEGFLDNEDWIKSDKILREWDAKVRAQDFDRTTTGNPRMDSVVFEGETHSVMDAINTLQGATAEFKAEINNDKFNVDFVFNQLVGDASPLARYSPYSMLAHQVTGDVRTNENVQLAAISNVFSANHNVLAGQIEEALGRIRVQYSGEDAEIPVGLENVVALANGDSFEVTNEEGEVISGVSNAQAIFDMARTVNNAAYQRMIYDQYVVHLSGGIHFGISSSQDKELMPNKDQILPQDINVNEHGFNGVNPEVDPNTSVEFSGAAFRVGHSQIYPDLNGIKAQMSEEQLEFGQTVSRSLIEGFINPTAIRQMGGSAGVLAQNSSDRAMAVDTFVVNEVRHMLVGSPNDLLAFNSERQYDMGIATLQETRQSLSDLFRDTGIANAKGSGASDASAGVYENGSEHNELADRLKPYSTWGEFKANLRDESLIDGFMNLFGGKGADLDNDYGLVDVPLYIGGLAEKQTDTPNGEGREPSLMGEVFTFLITTSFDEFQDPDEEYYKISIPGSDILKQLGHQTWTPMIQTALGLEAQAIHQDTFRVARTDVLEEGDSDFTAPEEHDFDGRAFNRIIYGNAEDNSIIGSDGESSELASSESYASDDIRAGAGDDYVNAKSGEDWVYGQAGDDTLSGGDDHAIDHVFGGEGDDTLYGHVEDALFGGEGEDVLIRLDGTGFHDGGLGDDIVLAGDSIDVVQGDSGEAIGENVNGNDILFGGKGSDEVAGEGGDDIVVGGESGRMSEDKIGDRLYGDAVAATHNAELLARAIRDEDGTIVDTIVPLKSELGYGVLVGGVNPLSGEMFSAVEISEFRTYIEGLRKVEDADDPAGRGPRPTMVVMPYAGPTGNDTIYTGRHSDIQSELGDRVDADELMSWMQRNGYAEAPEVEAEVEAPEVEAEVEAPEAEAEAEVEAPEAEAEAEAQEVEVEAPAFNFVGTDAPEVEAEAHEVEVEVPEAEAEVEVPEAEAEAEVPEAEAEDSRFSTDLVFADAGDDKIITDGSNSTYVFGGQGYDTLVSNLDSYNAPIVGLEVEVEAPEVEAPEAEAEVEAPEAEAEVEAPEAEAEVEAPEAEAEVEAPEAEALEAEVEAPAFDFSGAIQAEAEAPVAEVEAPEAEAEAHEAEVEVLESVAGMSIRVDSLNSYGADGVVSRSGVERSDSQDHFFSMEHVILDEKTQETQSNSLSVGSQAQPVTIDFRQADWGQGSILTAGDDAAKGLEVSNVNHYDLSRVFGYQENQATLKLGGKLDYDGKLDSDQSDDNYKISWDGKSLKVDSRATGKISLDGVKDIEFYHPTVDHASESFYYKEFAEKALDLGLSVVQDPIFDGEDPSEIVIRAFGSEPELPNQFYLAVTAESLREGTISTLDFTASLGDKFNEVFELNEANIRLTDDMAVQRSVEVIDSDNGNKSIRFTGSGLENLGSGEGVSSQKVLAYVGLDLRGDINELIKAERSEDAYGFMNKENFSVPLKFSVDANVDNVVWDDHYSLRDVGGQYAMLNADLEVVARSAEAKMSSTGSFDLGTSREITKYDEGSSTNLVRRNDTIMQSSTWQNEGEFSFMNLELEAVGTEQVEVTAQFSNDSQSLAELGSSSMVGEESIVGVSTTFSVIGEAGDVIDTSLSGYKLHADGDYMWDTTQMESFQVKHLITYQGDLNYDGQVGMRDLAALNAGAARDSVAHDVDANFDGSLDMYDLSIIDADWGNSIHQDDQPFTGSDKISMSEMFEQKGRSWDSSSFLLQNSLETGELESQGAGHERAFIEELESSNNLMVADGIDPAVMQMYEEQNQQYALTTY